MAQHREHRGCARTRAKQVEQIFASGTQRNDSIHANVSWSVGLHTWRNGEQWRREELSGDLRTADESRNKSASTRDVCRL